MAIAPVPGGVERAQMVSSIPEKVLLVFMMAGLIKQR